MFDVYDHVIALCVKLLLITYLRVSSIWPQDCQRTPAIAFAGIPPRGSSTYHCWCYFLAAVFISAVLVGDGGDVHLLQNIRLGPGHVDVPPASHQGGLVLVVLGRVGQADGLDSCKHTYYRLEV